MSTIAELNINITGTLDDLESAMSSAESTVSKSTKNMANAAKAAAGGISAAAVGIGIAGVNAANSLNENLANVQSLGVAEENVLKYRDAIQDMSVSVLKDTADLSDGLYQVISAFGESGDTIGVLEINAKAAAAGLATTTDAINLTSAVTKGYGDTSAEAVQQVSDLAFTTVQLGQTTFPELASSMGRVVPLGASMGASMEELFGVMATGTGVTGSAAEVSTQLRGVLQSLAAPTADMASLFEDLGVANGEALLEQEGLQGTIELVTKAAEDAGLPLQKYISSIEGQTLALALAGPQADVFTEKLAAMETAAGATDAAFTAQQDGINSVGTAIQRMRMQWQVFLENVGIALLPLIEHVTTLFQPLLERVLGLIDAFAALNPRLQTVIAGVAAVAAIMGSAIFVVGPLAAGFSALAPIVGGIAAAFALLVSPIGLVIAGLTAIVALDIGGVRSRLSGLAASFGSLVQQGAALVSNLANVGGAFFDAGAYSIEFNDAMSLIPESLQAPVEGFFKLVEAAGDTWDALKWVFSGEGAEIDWWWDITGAIADAFGLPANSGEEMADRLYDAGVRASEIMAGIKASWGLLTAFFSSAPVDFSTLQTQLQTISDAFGADFAAGLFDFGARLATLKSSITEFFDSPEIANLGDTAATAFSTVGTAIAGAFAGDIDFATLQATLETELANVGTALTAVFEGEAWAGLKLAFSNAFSSFANLTGLDTVLESIQTKLTEFTTAVEPFLTTGPIPRIKESITALGEIDITPITDGLTALKDGIMGFWSSIQTASGGSGDATGGDDILAMLGLAAVDITLNAVALAIDTAGAAIQSWVDTVGNVLTLFGAIIEGLGLAVEGLITGDMETAIDGAKLVLEGFVTFLQTQYETLTNLLASITEAVASFVGVTFDDLGITMPEPEWLTDLLDWAPDTPEWVTDLLDWVDNMTMPTWVQNLIDFRLPKPAWVDTLQSIIDRIPGVKARQLGRLYEPQSGLRLVGERGPELTWLPRGSTTMPAGFTNRLLEGMGGGGGVTVQQMIVRNDGDIYRIAQELEALQRRRG